MIRITVKRVRVYETQSGFKPFEFWKDNLNNYRYKYVIDTRIDRIKKGNLGVYRYLKDGLFELKIDIGPGFRIYFSLEGEDIILLLMGGDKRTQFKDIRKAKEYWEDYKNGRKK